MKYIQLFLAIIMPLLTYAQSPVLFGDNLEGSGVKMMWIPEKAAFRAGRLDNLEPTNCDLDSLGYDSFASGRNTKASGTYSTAMGFNTTASSYSSTVMGFNTTASGSYSTAMGSTSKALGSYSTAMGFNTTESANSSTAMGVNTTASANSSTAMGINTTASGTYSTAMGNEVSTNGRKGALIIGDSDPLDQGETYGGDDDQFVARFRNGYFFMTSGNDSRTAMVAGAGANAWSGISDVNRKENFQVLDDKEVLHKLASLDYSSWNYKCQDPTTFRHYGIMAQDFYELFGQDEYGTIGNDTLVNPLDMMGVAMSAIKGAKLEIEELKKENTRLENRMLAIEELLAIKNEVAIARTEE